MSKIGKKSILVPTGVEVTLAGELITVKGPKGTLHQPLVPGIQMTVADNTVSFRRKGDGPKERGFHGLMRALVNNMVTGVSKGFQKRLELVGVGYRAQATGKKITLNLGFSHPVEFHAPEGIDIKMDEEQKNVIIISGADRQKVGQVASNIRGYRPPEPYKGKGIRYTDEHVVRKSGKTAAKGAE